MICTSTTSDDSSPSLGSLADLSLQILDALVELLHELLSVRESRTTQVLEEKAIGEGLRLHKGEISGAGTREDLVVLELKL